MGDTTGQATVKRSMRSHHFSLRHFLELLTVMMIVACAVYSFWPSYTGPAQLHLDHQQISYQGRVAQNKFNGQGSLKIAAQGTYVGQFVDGRFDGRGHFKSLKGWTYSGHFHEGAISGQGQITNRQQKVIGKYKNGVLQQP